ncbi:MAG: DUF2490 domain-containing protein [Gammaproteobacteria bacterium]|nr:DUF2490 domain-containing protein [Gammaproteobacteria bacterium]
MRETGSARRGSKIAKRYLLCGACMLFLCSPIFGSTEHQARIWSGIDVLGEFKSSNYLYNFNLQSRHSNDPREYFDFRNELGFGYKLTPTLSAWLGYTGFLPNPPRNRQNRIWEQLLWGPINICQFSLISRTRFEQRKDDHQPEWSNRFRERLILSFPQKKITPLIYDEIFFNLNTTVWTSNKFFDQNRIFVGFLIPVDKHSNFQIGYLNVYSLRPMRDRIEHVLSLNLNITP